MKWHSVWHSDLWRRLKGKRAELKETPDQAWVEAAQGLYKKLQKGVYTVRRNVCKPINYDARKLWYAKDLTLPEQELLREVRHTQQTLPGTVEPSPHRPVLVRGPGGTRRAAVPDIVAHHAAQRPLPQVLAVSPCGPGSNRHVRAMVCTRLASSMGHGRCPNRAAEL